MSVNYFGKRRLEKILLNYISENKEFTETINAKIRKDFINYRRYNGLEEFQIGTFEISTITSDKMCHISLCISEYDENDVKKVKIYEHARYTADFYPYDGEPKLKCYEIFKKEKMNDNSIDRSD